MPSHCYLFMIHQLAAYCQSPSSCSGKRTRCQSTLECRTKGQNPKGNVNAAHNTGRQSIPRTKGTFEGNAINDGPYGPYPGCVGKSQRCTLRLGRSWRSEREGEEPHRNEVDQRASTLVEKGYSSEKISYSQHSHTHQQDGRNGANRRYCRGNARDEPAT